MPERPVNPTNEDVIRAWIEAYQQDHQVALPARVQTCYAETQEADLVPVVKHSVPQPDGSYVYEDLPVLPHVPIIHPRTANAFIHLPIAAGDFVLVICTSACAEFWRAGDGSPQYPGDQARNHLQNAVALPGFFPLGNRPGSSPPANWPLPITAGNRRDLIISLTDGGTGSITITADGTVHLGGTAGEQFVALAQKVTDALDALKDYATTHTHPVTGGVATASHDTLTVDTACAAAGVKARGSL